MSYFKVNRMTPPRSPVESTAFASRASTPYFQLTSLLVLGTIASLIALSVHAQPAEPTTTPAAAQVQEVSSPAPRATPPAEPSKPTASKYSARDIDRAFGYMDGNRDGKVSRDEASGFKKVAKYFDRADTDKDTVLSRDEFVRALNHKKP